VDVAKSGPVTIGPPLRGGAWLAGNGPANASGHRRALFALGGRAVIGQRFAIDWVKVNPQGRTFDGDAKQNAAYLAHGQEAIAVADGTIAAIKDGIPENVPGITSRAVPITMDTIGGNFVVLDLGEGRYAFYAHLQPGSLRVKTGDKVNRGRVLGLVGNSGNSTEPHLHFHVSDGLESLSSEGLPYVLDAFEIAAGPGGFERRSGELPMNNAVVRFPDK
jgi:murein DD-endopeptidase MepM/ murein hydrolase activator NlpD